MCPYGTYLVPEVPLSDYIIRSNRKKCPAGTYLVPEVPFHKYDLMPSLPIRLPPTPSHSPVTRHNKVMKYIIQFPIYKHTKVYLYLQTHEYFLFKIQQQYLLTKIHKELYQSYPLF